MNSDILVVDDEESITFFLTRLLKKGGYSVESANSSTEALKMVEEENYGVVLLDIMMPEMDGIEFLEKIKESNPDVYVIMMTANANVDYAISSLKLGARDFIKKPYSNEEILGAVEKGVESIKKEQGEEELILSRELLENLESISSQSIGNLARAIEKLSGIEASVEIGEPVVEEVGGFPRLVKGNGISILGSMVWLSGGLSGMTGLFFPVEDAMKIVELLGDKEVDYAEFPLAEDKEIIREVGNIVSEKCASKLSPFLGEDVSIMTQSFASFLSGNFRSMLELRTGKKEQKYIGYNIKFRIGRRKLSGYFLLIFDHKNLEILNSLYT